MYSGGAKSHLILLRQLADLLYVTFVGYDDQRLQGKKDQSDFNDGHISLRKLTQASVRCSSGRNFDQSSTSQTHCTFAVTRDVEIEFNTIFRCEKLFV